MKLSRLEYLRLWGTVTLGDVRDWCLRWIWAQHNARVIADFEDRMSMVVYAATGGMMSKSYYAADTMLNEIREAQDRAYEDAYNDGRRDARDEQRLVFTFDWCTGNSQIDDPMGRLLSHRVRSALGLARDILKIEREVVRNEAESNSTAFLPCPCGQMGCVSPVQAA